MDTPYRVMTVCTGNICRSPMAEVVLRTKLEEAGLADVVEVDSTGISDEEHGNPVDRRARAVLRAHGYPTGERCCGRTGTPPVRGTAPGRSARATSSPATCSCR
ncbi:arsenate reductase/protein-tyrosine-phosphatase family protein [Cellulomonas telluris]|uniref:arsenate reductase/protein-tyrosine-phosphatase family protein n=1 Tax=Cellulomonas telluris TaxID=2306636 RepID=UPI003522799F